ncbi:MAG: RNA 2',3'-cyclic phosphodiesterase [Melioribacter sp.]|nr:RNA 2',3'-cyclic phosphodiesterase [Melioribacter sp.]
MMIRTFIALEIPQDIIDEIITIRNNMVPSYQSIKWESREKLHVTLKFLGETEQETIEKIFASLEKLSTKYHKFDLQLDRFGFFKSNGVPRILWAGLKENFELENFVQEIDILCSEFGFEKEKRKFKPHITMLRIKNESIIKEVNSLDNYRLPQLKFVGNKIIMFQSILTKGGSIYKPIKSLLL